MRWTNRLPTVVLLSVLAGSPSCRPANTGLVEAEPIRAEEAPVPVNAPTADRTAPFQGPPFAFAADAGGQLLKRLLVPPMPAPLPPPRARQPLNRAGLPEVEAPALLLPAFTERPPRLPLPVASLTGPYPLPDAFPLEGSQRQAPLPRLPNMPRSPLLREPSRPVDEPLALPSQAVRVADRAALGDPTTADSVTLALTAPIPMRTKSAAFVRRDVPDPFENQEAVRLRRQPMEEPESVRGR